MKEQRPFTVHALELGPMENFIYFIRDTDSGRTAVVDPAWDVPAIRNFARAHDMQITDILLTHSHHDHVNGVDELLQDYDAQLHLLHAEAQFWGARHTRPALHYGGDSIAVGKTDIEVLHTPGHTPGSACYRMGDQLITGDTLFVFGCGRCDMQGGDPEQMFVTLKDIVSRLPSETVILPGHNYAEKATSTLQEQAQGNPFLHFTEVDRFVKYRMVYHDKHRHDPYGPICKGDEMPE